MSLIVKSSSGPKIAPPDEGSYAAVCTQLVDIGLQHISYEGTEKDVNQVVIVWELAGETIDLGETTVPRTVSKTYTMSLHERSGLRKDLKSWRGREFTDEELKAFDLSNVLGAPCMIQIVHKVTANGTYANIASIMSLPKGMPKPQASMPLVAFDADTATEADLDKLPSWIADKVKASATWVGKSAGALVQELADDDGELPF